MDASLNNPLAHAVLQVNQIQLSDIHTLDQMSDALATATVVLGGVDEGKISIPGYGEPVLYLDLLDRVICVLRRTSRMLSQIADVSVRKEAQEKIRLVRKNVERLELESPYSFCSTTWNPFLRMFGCCCFPCFKFAPFKEIHISWLAYGLAPE